MISLGALKPRLLFDKRCTVRFFKKISYTKFCGHKTQILTNHQEDQTLKSKILTWNEAYSLLVHPPTGRPVPWASNPREVTLACVTVTSHDSDVLSSWTRQSSPGTLKRNLVPGVWQQNRGQLSSPSTTLPQAGELRGMMQPPGSLSVS